MAPKQIQELVERYISDSEVLKSSDLPDLMEAISAMIEVAASRVEKVEPLGRYDNVIKAIIEQLEQLEKEIRAIADARNSSSGSMLIPMGGGGGGGEPEPAASSLVKVEVDYQLFVSEGDSQPVVIYTTDSNVAIRGAFCQYTTELSYNNGAGSIGSIVPTIEIATSYNHVVSGATIGAPDFAGMAISNEEGAVFPQVLVTGSNITLDTATTTDNSASEDFWTMADAGLLTFWFDLVELS